MGQLYEKMASDLKLRRYSTRTQKSYLWAARRFVRHFMRAPDEMGMAEITQFLLMLHDRAESAASIKMYVASLHFLYGVTLNRPAEVENIPWPRVVQKLPAVVSRAEVEALLGKIEPLVCRMVVMTAYGTGLRISEILALETRDIDGKAGLIHVRHGKGDRPRLVTLPRRLLKSLREYWRLTRPAGPLVFPGQNPSKPLCPDTARRAVHRASAALGISRRVTMHAFRHYAESPVMPSCRPSHAGIAGIPGSLTHPTRHNQRLCRKASSLSSGRKRAGRTAVGAVLARARSLSWRLAAK
jgi:integrase